MLALQGGSPSAKIFARGSREPAPVALLAKCEPLFASVPTRGVTSHCHGMGDMGRDGKASTKSVTARKSFISVDNPHGLICLLNFIIYKSGFLW